MPMLVYYVQLMAYRGDSASEKSEEEGVDEQKGDVSFLSIHTCVGVQGQQCYLISGNGCATPEAALRWCKILQAGLTLTVAVN